MQKFRYLASREDLNTVFFLSKRFFCLSSLLLVMCLGALENLQAQVITVYDNESRQPLDLVTVLSQNPKAFVVTDPAGQADISDFKGSLKIEVRALGYKTLALAFHQLESRNFKVYLERTSMRLDQAVVSATRWRQAGEDVSQKIAKIAPIDVALQNPQTAADLLAISGKVFVQKSQQGGGSPMIRGFSANRLLYTIDGVRMNTAIFRSGNLQNVINIDAFAIESTEVLFGPGSVIYGSDAIGGVMAFQTLTPEFSQTDEPIVKGKADLRYASANNENTGHFDVNVGWKKWSMVTSISSWKFDHLRQGNHGPTDYLKPFHVQRIDSTDVVVAQDDPLLQIPSGYSQINFMQKLRFRLNDQWDFTYGFHYSETSSYGRYDRHNRMRNGLPRHGTWNYGPQKWMMNNLSINHKSKSNIFDEMTIRLAHQFFEESRVDRNFNSDLQRTTMEEVDAFSANFDFIKALSKQSTIYYGVEGIYNDVRSNGITDNLSTGEQTGVEPRYPASDWTSAAMYVTGEYRADDKLTLNAGVRYNFFALNSSFDSDLYTFPFEAAQLSNDAVTGSVGAVYRPDSTWVITSNLGSAFRAPNVDDVGKIFDSEPGSVTVPNANLKSEYALNADLGVAKIIGGVLKIEVTGFYTVLENAMVRRDFQFNGQDSILYRDIESRVQAVQNAAMANVYGLQTSVELRIGGGWSFSSDLNFQRGTEEMDDGTISASRHAAPLFGASRLNYVRNRLRLQVYALYQGELSHERLAIEEQSKNEIYALDGNGDTFAPAWYTLNFKALYAINDHFSLSTGLENITDQRYRPYSSGISAAGRNFILSARVNF